MKKKKKKLKLNEKETHKWNVFMVKVNIFGLFSSLSVFSVL